jgi:hypothetical protein
MEKRKTIQINPNFFKMGKKTKTKKEKKRPDLRQTLKPNNLKKQLLSRIKNHQQEQVDKKSQGGEVEKFKDDFNSSLNYLQTMIKQKKNKKRQRTRKKKVAPVVPAASAVPAPMINTQPFATVVSADSPYGCLKNGTKPTYSQYMKTMKKKPSLKKQKIQLPPKPPPSAQVMERQDKLNKLKETMAMPKKEKILKTINKKRTIKIFKLGKKEGKVGVLVKSGKTRKRVKEEHRILHSKCILEVKQYLRKHNLIKAGTSAPDNILRKLYEDSFLAGDIYNKNPDILLHNFMDHQS